ncbi:hypothetical protein BCR37DRAFT_393246 [Protomyces lactucae-debilis]|uniref:Uncharacterized protein n=1 Tax=Protomyces lactucae-debilis TaxID=2754530 RepID=A0A1Y2FBU9_PROLT|nr:uncharacterized protein BCR37DRAFT_393246 [Protomyces lactucae-debilis]ORY81371.1 hypothetical protein BCR37DRAFT_393246 [Protomyces lactucae-debilis]
MGYSIGRTRGRTAKHSPRGSLASLKLNMVPATRPELYAQPAQETIKGHSRSGSNVSGRGSRRSRLRHSIQEYEADAAEETWRALVRSLVQAVQLRFSQGLTEFVIMLERSADFQDLSEAQLQLFADKQTSERIVLQCQRKLRKKSIMPQFKLVFSASQSVVGIECHLPVDALKPGVCQALDTLREEARTLEDIESLSLGAEKQ